MHIQAYEQAVFDIIEDLKEYRAKRGDRFRYSDIFDEAGNQYVNLVQEGGGILGIALVGFTYVLEEMGIRFLSLGGTSAGSINALLMADLGTPEEKKSVRILERIATKDFMDFVDGGYDAEQLTAAFDSGNKIQLYLHLITNIAEIKDKLGINPGLHFEDWLREMLRHDSWEGLKENLCALPESLYHLSNYGKRRRPVTAGELDPKIAIVAADITTQTKVEFPRMAHLYYAEPEAQNPASFVRASMSIPFFFEPKRASLAWTRGKEDEVRRRWRAVADYTGELPKEIVFVDGGVMSNFPIDLFHQPDVIPLRPTIGVKLGVDRNYAREIDGLADFIGNMASGVRNLRDFEFIRNHPEYKDLVEYIDIEGFNWIDFNISEAEKLKLFRQGARAASHFLRRFNWSDYKDTIKANLLRRIKPVMWELSDLRDLSDTLEVLGIHDDKELEARINRIQQRKEPYNVLWIDDAFTYALPLAILDRLHTFCYSVRTSDEAMQLLMNKNKFNDDPTTQIDLIISDVTRREDKGNDKLRGLDFAALLAEDPDWKEIPVLMYAHDREDLVERYGGPIPPNIVNRPEKNTIVHRHFIEEVIEGLTRRLGQSSGQSGTTA
ncbi:patatin-like phospholipase [Neolewinella xylanilytica]|uniref:Patatin-like phospholipase n=1 Tax=Neolewinella xylanilytica TaxID=1514080 RepID=A0A2S6I220_9BACT|nr:patatin-like phospholipase family protein [Neolewinella xylanilytica]PPK85131.1 patatin-like phospholipase [Neolewinella xylanilytica]